MPFGQSPRTEREPALLQNDAANPREFTLPFESDTLTTLSTLSKTMLRTDAHMGTPLTPEYDPAYTDCPVCRTSNIALYHRDFRDNRIFRCDTCGVQFMNPVYSDDYLARYYARYPRGDLEDRWRRQDNSNRIKFRAIERFIQTPGKLLDFGCGNGNFIRFALSRGWQAMGYDLDCGIVREVARLLDVDAHCGDLHAIHWPAASFDLLHAHHVVEHLKHPVRDLNRLNHWLKPGAYFYLAAPNIDSLASRLKYRAENVGLRRKNIGKYYDTDHHIFYYSPKTMSRLLQHCGFEVLMTMNGNKLHIGDSRLAQFFSHTLMNSLYSSSTFFVIARKIRDAL